MKKPVLLLTSIALVCSLSSLTGCAKKTEVVYADAGYVNVNAYPNKDPNINTIRLTALRETATGLGARGALAWRSYHINKTLDQEATYLDHVFNFNELLLSSNVLPPILVEDNNSLSLNGSDAFRSANKTYRIIAQARFVTAPPTWHDYLFMPYQKPNPPDKSLMPNTQAEAIAWNQYLREGWEQGLAQANDIFSTNLNRLKRDYLGMILYRKLLAQNMISSPIVAKANLGITGNSQEIRINDEIMRITAQSALQLNSSEWKPIITPATTPDQ